jgi:hypothetical protein
MKTSSLSLIAVLGLGVLFGSGSLSATQQEEPRDGPEVLASGPVHAAYAEPVSQMPPPSEVVPKPPPDPIPELPPEQKPEGDNVQWIPGYWHWDDDRQDYIWVSGFWRMPPPDRQWVPGHWMKVEGGWQWSPGFWSPIGQNQFDYLPPPPAPLEATPSVPAPSEDSYYVPGCWVYRENRYLWRPGAWVAYRPGWVWVPACYLWTPCGYLFVDGYWDYPLGNRGLLFAPVYVRRGLYPANWYFTPRFAVAADFLLSALFVRPATCHYYFGDFFAPRYARAGFVPWVDYRYARGHHDPVFTYYRFRHGPAWERDLRGLYGDRFAGRAVLPPRTLAQQNTLVQNLVKERNVNQTVINRVTALAPVTQAAQRNNIKLAAVTRDVRIEEQKQAQRLHELARERQRVEAQLLAKGPPTKPTDPPREAKLDLPKPPRPAPAVKPPPPPPRPEKPVASPPPKKEVPPPPKKEVTPPPPTKEVTLPPPKHEPVPPLPKKEVTPPPKKEVPPPPVKKEAPPPPPAKQETARPSPQPQPKKELPPPAPIRREPVAPPRHDVHPPPPPKPEPRPPKESPVLKESAPRRALVRPAAPSPARHEVRPQLAASRRPVQQKHHKR